MGVNRPSTLAKRCTRLSAPAHARRVESGENLTEASRPAGPRSPPTDLSGAPPPPPACASATRARVRASMTTTRPSPSPAASKAPSGEKCRDLPPPDDFVEDTPAPKSRTANCDRFSTFQSLTQPSSPIVAHTWGTVGFHATSFSADPLPAMRIRTLVAVTSQRSHPSVPT